MEKRSTSAAIRRAINLAGSEKKLGDAAGYSQNAIWAAKRKGQVSAEMAVAIEKATGGQVTKTELRPDLFAPIHMDAAS